MIDYDQKKFRSLSNSPNGEVGGETVFHYRQEGAVVWATYQGGSILFGTLTGLVQPDGHLHFAYQHINQQHELMTGKCSSVPEVLPDQRLRLHETWQWTCRDYATGTSVIEELS
jgi:hypothetical protein